MKKELISNYHFYLINKNHGLWDGRFSISRPRMEKYREIKHRGLSSGLLISTRNPLGVLVTCGENKLKDNTNIILFENSRPGIMISEIKDLQKYLKSNKRKHNIDCYYNGEVNINFSVGKDSKNKKLYLQDILYNILYDKL
jgi:hypothetical protein